LQRNAEITNKFSLSSFHATSLHNGDKQVDQSAIIVV